MARIALLEDDTLIAELLSRILSLQDHDVHVFDRTSRFTNMLRHDTFDLLLLDWNLPDGDGLDVLRWCRETLGTTLPIVMLTGRDDEADIVAALEAGVDDYITKPFSPAIVAARVQAALRRTQPASQDGSSQPPAGVSIDAATATVAVDGRAAELSPKELALAQVFFANPNRSLSRAYLSERALGKNPDLPSRTLDVQVGSLKRKLDLVEPRRVRLTSIYSFGYRLDVDTPA